MADLALDEKSAKSEIEKSDRTPSRHPSAIKPSPLEEENRSLKAMVDQMSKELQMMKDRLQEKDRIMESEEERKEALYELRRELFKV